MVLLAKELYAVNSIVMSGHSKWATIKRQKAVVDAKRGVVYAKMAREIIVAAKLGGPDPQANFRLRTAIERAKAEGVPNDNIERAIEKGSGAGGASDVEELTYEGYGPGGIAILVKCATDNRHRTAGDLRFYFSKNGGNMGESGCVAWMFKERGEITIPKDQKLDEDELLLKISDAGADDLLDQDDYLLAICPAPDFENVQKACREAGASIESADLVMSPDNTVEVTDKTLARSLLKLIDTLENHDDVQHVYANFDMNSDWLEEFGREN